MTITPSNNLNLFGYKDFFLHLKNLYDKNLLPNKIIFSGNKGIGKATFAYHLANYIFSLNEENNYNFLKNTILINNHSYKMIQKNSHTNFFLITNEDAKIINQINRVREMINFTNKSSFNNEEKIVMIDNVEYLNKNSVNALLKIIEEPNNKIYFFLIYDNKSKILDTLSSRCIKFNLILPPQKKDQIINHLLNNNFYNNLNDDFKNFYSSPGQILLLQNIFKENII